ncbi:biotin carboxylase N-terminal domain-containing protein [Sodalis-like endosymbiont of Proechinophthirus fluctus]|nr:biotin carboxylase N-terminal domain-containing protein [Sodalis-like endosymbiont of Proechinophthirus fluctus]
MRQTYVCHRIDLIANRREIALRILLACGGLGLKTIVARSDGDAKADYIR